MVGAQNHALRRLSVGHFRLPQVLRGQLKPPEAHTARELTCRRAKALLTAVRSLPAMSFCKKMLEDDLVPGDLIVKLLSWIAWPF